MTNRPITIYALCDPDTNEVRYIGQSVTPKNRLKTHIINSFDGTTKRDEWIRSLLVNGKLPTLRALSLVDSEHADAAEIQAIEQAKQDGAILVNSTEGANGGSNHDKRPPRPEHFQMTFNVSRHTAEIIERLSSEYGSRDTLLMLLVDRFTR